MDLTEHFGKPKILIIDDDIMNLELIKGVLDENYEIFMATDGKEGLFIIETHNPDLIILDIMMPGINGYDICSNIKNNTETCDIPIIFITSIDESEFEEKGLAMGAIDYITKPINPGIMKLRVRNHIELKQSKDILKKLSTIDGLTGIANRRSFEECIEREWRRCMRNRTPVSLLMLDIDYFKKYNDTYGHLEGDKCLIAVGKTLRTIIRRGGDLCARFGGEEFVVVLPETGIEAALLCADKLVNGIRALNIKHESSTAAGMVTVSIGISSIVPETGTDFHTLIQQADEALYTAKNLGRNRAEPFTK